MRRIYAVDDEPDLLEIYTNVLSRFVEAKTFSTPEELFQKLDQGEKAPDAFVLDLNLPTMSGTEVLEKLRQRGIHKPAILVSGYSEGAFISQAMKLGSVQILEKPFSIELFKIAARNAIVCSISQDIRTKQSAFLAELSQRLSLASLSLASKDEIQAYKAELDCLEEEIEKYSKLQ